jgi:hypothetical protein
MGDKFLTHLGVFQITFTTPNCQKRLLSKKMGFANLIKST